MAKSTDNSYMEGDVIPEYCSYMDEDDAPEFFTVLIIEEQSKMIFPRSFQTQYSVKLGPICTLEDKSSKKIWETKVKTLSDGRICLKHGWEQFHKDHNLRAGDFLTFHMISPNHFFVKMYDATGCAKEIQQQSGSFGQETDDASSSQPIASPSFKSAMTISN
ncbi:putative B3 domain-containing protein Os03g0621600 [Salvia splendens]|uniref:putative B3 domain-containing protein Os03g0621600 n=1 Tax=Salvia splendens TaxID=180675 RepID=UPI001C27FF03|nr:putative B3 domain-containing protein Os03g0621600 [Salvia splendens]